MCVLARELLIQGNSPPQNAVEDIGSNSSSSEAGNFRLGGRARTRHTRIVVAKLCPRRELPPKMSESAQLFVEGSYLPSAMARSLRLPSSEACAALPAASMRAVSFARVAGSLTTGEPPRNAIVSQCSSR